MKKEQIREIVEVTTETVLSQRDKILKREIDEKFHDVKLLMANYRALKAHYSHTSPDSLGIDSIYAPHKKTGLMMSHVDKMLNVYEVLCASAEQEDEARRWQVIYLRYVGTARYFPAEIAKTLNIDKRTVYRDINKALEDLTVLLFGIEALEVWRAR